MTIATRTTAGLVSLTLAGLAYGAAEAHWYALRRLVVPVLPPGADPIKILHISDLHLTAGQRRKATWVAALAQLEPDLVVTTGDNLGGQGALTCLKAALEPLLGLTGGFVFGSNDFFSSKLKNPFAYFKRDSEAEHRRRPDLPVVALRQLLMSGGWLDLNNARGWVSVAAGMVELVGLADPHLGLDRLPAPQGSDVGRQGPASLVKLGLVHAPYQGAVRALVQDGAGLTLAGHTHGGQVALPWHGALISNCDLPPRFAKGLHRLAPRSGWLGALAEAPASVRVPGTVPAPAYLHVSAGLGTSPYAPVRFACRPEANLLTLVPFESR